MKRGLIPLAIISLILIVFLLGRPSEAALSTNASLETLLVDDGRTSPAYARALLPDDVRFPRDLGPHEDYQTEWWYYTGNLEAEDGRPFGYQFTIFRRSLVPTEELEQPDDPSEWRGNQVYLAHFTVSDIAAEEFYTAEHFSREAGGLAGAQAEPYRVWLENWSAEQTADGQVRLQAETDEVALDLLLTETVPPVLHGQGGLSRKGMEPGNASYYYSIIQQESVGELSIGEETFAVSGLSWKDHEYSTSALSPGSVGWDWFSLQLDDGSALMLFQIRRVDGSLEPASSGTFIHPDGSTEALSMNDWALVVDKTWTSSTSGAEYPVAWRLSLPGQELELQGQAMMPNQELNVSTVYWEGAVQFQGQRAGQPVNAEGYIEMTGYVAPAEE